MMDRPLGMKNFCLPREVILENGKSREATKKGFFIFALLRTREILLERLNLQRKLFASAGALSVLRCAICSGLPELKLLLFFASRTIGSPFLIKFRASLLKKRLKKEELKFFAILKLSK